MRRHITVLFILYFLSITTLFAQQNQHPSLDLPEGAKARLGKGRPYKVEYTADGMRLAVATSIGVWFYDSNTYEPLMRLSKHKYPLRYIAFTPDGNILVNVDAVGNMHLWNVNTAKFLGEPRRQLPFTSMAMSPDGNTIVTADLMKRVNFWDMQKRQETQFYNRTRNEPHILDVQGSFRYGLTFSPDGSLLVHGNQNPDIDVWDGKTGSHIRKLQAHTSIVHNFAFSPDGKTLASASHDQSVRLWDIDSGEQTHFFEGRGRVGNSDIVYSPDGSLLVTAGRIGEIIVLDGNTAEYKQTLLEHTQRVNDIAFSPDMRSLASCSYDGTVRIWNVASGENTQIISNHFGEFTSFAWSKDGKTIIAPSLNLTIYLWDEETHQLRKTYAETNRVYRIFDIAVSPIDTSVALATSDGLVSIRDAETGEQMGVLSGGEALNLCVAYSPDGKTIAAGSRDQLVRMWDVETGEIIRTLEGHNGEIRSIAFSPDGSMIACGGTKMPVLLWDAETGEINPILNVSKSGVTDIAFSPDGQTLAVSLISNPIHLYDLETGAEKQLPFDGDNRVFPSCLDFSADGKRIAFGSTDGTVSVLDVGTGVVLHKFEGHGRPVVSVAFSPDGKSLVSNSRSGVMYLWDVE